MSNPFESDDQEYIVLTNDEGQFSLWPSFRETPDGWTIVGPRGQRSECLSWIDRMWTDMRPLSLIRRMEEDVVGGNKGNKVNNSELTQGLAPDDNRRED
jgi:MbtH protein